MSGAEREAQIVNVVDGYIEEKVKSWKGYYPPDSPFYPSKEERRAAVRLDICVQLENGEVPNGLTDFSLVELRWYFERENSGVSLQTLKTADMFSRWSPFGASPSR